VRLRASGGGREITLDMTEVRLDLAAPELFLPPSDFTRYASSLALMNELMIREASNRQAPSEAITGEQQPAISKYNGQQGQPGMMR
jgi:hypothetical protein